VWSWYTWHFSDANTLQGHLLLVTVSGCEFQCAQFVQNVLQYEVGLLLRSHRSQCVQFQECSMVWNSLLYAGIICGEFCNSFWHLWILRSGEERLGRWQRKVRRWLTLEWWRKACRWEVDLLVFVADRHYMPWSIMHLHSTTLALNITRSCSSVLLVIVVIGYSALT